MPTVVYPATQALALDHLRDASQWGAADPQVVATTAARIAGDDPDAWLREWTAAGGAAWAAAGTTGDPYLYLHAAFYYGAALALIADTDGSVDEMQLWRRQRECWDRAVPGLGGEHLSVPHEQARLPGYFFSAGPGARPLVVVDHGGRAPTSRVWAGLGAAAHARGYHWMTFDGPGGQAALRRLGLVLRPDWETVLSPVADAMIARPDVDGARIAVVGLDLAAFGVARALSCEHRFGAAAVAPGIVDASHPWLDALPDSARVALLGHDRDAFDRELHVAELFAPGTEDRLRRHARCFDLSGMPLYDLYRHIDRFRLGAEVELIATPLLVCTATVEHPWPGQEADLYERLRCPRALCAATGGAGTVLSWIDGRL